MTKQEARDAAASALRQDASLSDREVGRRVGAAAATVARIRSRLESEGVIAPTAVRIGRDGRKHPVTAPLATLRKPGDLPDPGLRELLGDGVAMVFSSAERRRQRRTANYLKRLAVAFEDQRELEGWSAPGDAASACIATFGQRAAAELAEVLGYFSARVYRVAVLLKKAGSDGSS